MYIILQKKVFNVKGRRCAKFGFKSGNVLVAALLYLLLKNPSHGYSLVEELENLGIDPNFVPYSVAYRLLRDMENDGLITSEWEIEESGPSRRIYSITNEGIEFLKRWVNNAENNLKIMENLVSNINDLFQQKKEKI